MRLTQLHSLLNKKGLLAKNTGIFRQDIQTFDPCRNILYSPENVVTLKFFFDVLPIPKQSARFTVQRDKKGNVITYKDKQGITQVISHVHSDPKRKQYIETLRTMAIQQLPDKFTIFSKMVDVVRVMFVYPPASYLPKKVLTSIEAGGLFPKTTTPDLVDNLVKPLYDALAGVVFSNDGLIWKETEKGKFFGKPSGIYIEIQGF
jgi:Holliday junction resolvase RusA-like endonuclease